MEEKKEKKEKKERQTFQGEADELVACLAGVVEGMGRNWLTFPEQKLVLSARTDQEKIAKASPILQALHGIQANLSFPKGTVHLAVQLLYERFSTKPGWKLQDAHVAAYIGVMSCRIANVCRAFTNAATKHHTLPKWIHEAMPWYAAPSSSAKEEENEEKKERKEGEKEEEEDEEEKE